jgi:bifunctional non-homologous end joining protein LigD
VDGPAAAPRVVIKNARKVFWPAEGYTKGDLAAYYEAVAPWLLPYLHDRPIVLVRYPDGIEGKSFFQKDAPPTTPAWMRTVRIPSSDPPRDIDYLLVDDTDGLRWVVNLGTIPIHVWASRAGSLERPDWLVMDLDPKGAPFAHVVRIARVLRGILDDLGAPSYPKTSGKTGLHVLVPMGARYSYDDTRAFGELLARLVVEREPRLATVARPLRERGGRVYVDVGQNAPGQTIVAPFAVRERPGAPVSCPLAWDEVDDRLDPRQFTIRTVPERLASRPDPMAPVLGPGVDLPAVLRRLEERLGRLTPPGAPVAGRRGRARARTPRA